MKSIFILIATFNDDALSGEFFRVYKKGFLSKEDAEQHIPEVIEKVKNMQGILDAYHSSIKVNIMEIEL